MTTNANLIAEARARHKQVSSHFPGEDVKTLTGQLADALEAAEQALTKVKNYVQSSAGYADELDHFEILAMIPDDI